MNSPVAIASAIFLLCLILFFNNVMFAVEGAFVSIFSPVRARDYKDDPYFKRSGILSFIIAIPLFAFCLTTCGISKLNFWPTTLVILAFTAVRYLSAAIPSSINHNYKMMEEVRASNSAFVLVSILSIPAVIYCLIVTPQSNIVQEIWIGSITLFFVIIRYFGLLHNFFALKFSQFFTFLYLCGLKIIPIAVAVKVLVY